MGNSRRDVGSVGGPPPLPRQAIQVGYAMPGLRAEQRMPGSLITIGVLSIFVGLLGTLLHAVSLYSVQDLFRLARWTESRAPATLAPPAPPPAPMIKPYAGDLFSEAGLDASGREAVLKALEHKGTLNADRREMLRRLLGECGKQMFPSGQPSGPETIADVEVGQLPAGPDGIGALGTNYYRTARWTVTLDDARACFYLSGTPEPELSVWRDAVFPRDGDGHTSRVALAERIEQQRQKLGPQFNALQARVLADRWMTRHFPIIPPFGSQAPRRWNGPEERDYLVMLQDGPLEISTRAWVMPNGALIENRGDVDPRTGIRRVPPPPPSKRHTLTPVMVWVVTLDLVLGICLALLLLAIGIEMFTATDKSVPHHVMWAWMRLLGTVLFAAPSFVIGVAAVQEMNRPDLAALTNVSTVVGLLVQLTYPVIVLMVMRSIPVQTYFARNRWSMEVLAAQSQCRVQRFRQWISGRGGRIVLAAVGTLTLGATFVYYGAIDRVDVDAWWSVAPSASALIPVGIIAGASMLLVALTLRRATVGVTVAVALVLLVGAQAQQMTVDPAHRDEVNRLLERASRKDQTARDALTKLAKENDPALYEALGSGDLKLTAEAVRAMNGIAMTLDTPKPVRKSVDDAIPKLTQLIRENAEVRQQAMDLIFSCAQSVPISIQLMDDKDPQVKRFAMRTLNKNRYGFGDKEKRAALDKVIPDVVNLLGGELDTEARGVIECGISPVVIDSMLARLKKEPASGKAIVAALGPFVGGFGDMHKVILTALAVGDEPSQAAATNFIQESRKQNPGADAVRWGLKSDDPVVRQGAMRFIARTGEQRSDLPELIARPEALAEPAVREQAAVVLANRDEEYFERLTHAALFGPNEKDAMEKLMLASTCLRAPPQPVRDQSNPRRLTGTRLDPQLKSALRLPRAAQREALNELMWPDDVQERRKLADFLLGHHGQRMGPVSYRATVAAQRGLDPVATAASFDGYWKTPAQWSKVVIKPIQLPPPPPPPPDHSVQNALAMMSALVIVAMTVSLVAGVFVGVAAKD